MARWKHYTIALMLDTLGAQAMLDTLFVQAEVDGRVGLATAGDTL